MANETQSFDLAKYFESLCSELAATEGRDKELCDILRRHILLASPGSNCVAEAAAAIGALAELRAEADLEGDK